MREFCLYPFELPSVLLDEATYRELEARGPRTDRVIQRRGPHPTPLVPGVINTQAPQKKQLAAYARTPQAWSAARDPGLTNAGALCFCGHREASGANAGTASGDGESAAEVVPPKPMFSSVASARAPVVGPCRAAPPRPQILSCELMAMPILRWARSRQYARCRCHS